MGMSLAKPTISASYILSLAINRKIKTVFVALFYIIFGIFYISSLIYLSLNTIIYRFISQIKYVANDGVSNINFLINLRIKNQIAIILSGLMAVIF